MCQDHKIVKHLQTIDGLLPANCFIKFDYFVGLALKRLKKQGQLRSTKIMPNHA